MRLRRTAAPEREAGARGYPSRLGNGAHSMGIPLQTRKRNTFYGDTPSRLGNGAYTMGMPLQTRKRSTFYRNTPPDSETDHILWGYPSSMDVRSSRFIGTDQLERMQFRAFQVGNRGKDFKVWRTSGDRCHAKITIRAGRHIFEFVIL